ncbi:unnamed protein product [Haemonchus placei]|uniref:Cyclin C-terminal domain-containing protein n=1 Tax=Haemonchus placei TaxID=6290 RepID=A0A3P7V893_HAEPC|nr:unnamed protein product [Haemonchus placei]
MTLLFLDIIYQFVLQSAVTSAEILKSISRADVERVKADWMLLGASTVTAAAMCVTPSQYTEQMVADLSKLAGTPREDVIQIVSAITHVTLQLQKSPSAAT